MATPTVTANLGNPATAHNPYNERGAWLDATEYAVDDVTSVGGSAWVCIAGHTSSATSKPPTGATYTTFWNPILDINSSDVTVITSPGASWAPTLKNGEIYYLEGANPTDVAPVNSPGTNTGIFVLIYVKGGSGLTFGGATVSGNVALSTDPSIVDLIALSNVDLNGSPQGWRVMQLDSTAAANALPAAITHEWLLTTDFTDSIGALNWTPVNAPAFVGSGDFGVSFVEASAQYATLASPFVDPNGDFTVFFCLPDIRTPPDDFDVFIGIGDAAGNDYVVVWQPASGHLIAHLDDAGGATADLTITNGNLPATHALFMLRRAGTTWDFECITNGVSDSTTYATVLTVDSSALGARVKAGAYSLHADRVLLAVWSADSAMTNTADINAVRSYVQTTRGLSNA